MQLPYAEGFFLNISQMYEPNRTLVNVFRHIKLFLRVSLDFSFKGCFVAR